MSILKQIRAGGPKFVARQVINTWQDVGKSPDRFNPIKFILLFRIRILLTTGDHAEVIKASTSLYARGIETALLYLATSNFLIGQLDCAETQLKQLLERQTNHTEASYMLSRIQVQLGNKSKARDLLKDLTKSTRLLRPWIMWSNLVENAELFKEYQSALIAAKQQKRIKNNSILITKCLTNAALRADLHEELVNIFQNTTPKTAKKPIRHRILTWMQDNFPPEFGKQALEHIHEVLENHSIEHFLISGTLLGCIREGTLLPHDSDLDIGVWIEDGIDNVSNLLLTSGYFYPVETRSKELLKIKHVTGIAIDIFFHRRNADEITHAGVKTVWHNHKFQLKEVQFLGQSYRIPEDPDRYLTENYGDWRKQKIQFDCALDTPNSTVYNQVEMDVYAMLKILSGDKRSTEYQQLISPKFIGFTKSNAHKERQ